jgi:hypothetical protein
MKLRKKTSFSCWIQNRGTVVFMIRELVLFSWQLKKISFGLWIVFAPYALHLCTPSLARSGCLCLHVTYFCHDGYTVRCSLLLCCHVLGRRLRCIVVTNHHPPHTCAPVYWPYWSTHLLFINYTSLTRGCKENWAKKYSLGSILGSG